MLAVGISDGCTTAAYDIGTLWDNVQGAAGADDTTDNDGKAAEIGGTIGGIDKADDVVSRCSNEGEAAIL